MKRLCLVLAMTLVFGLEPGAGRANGPLLVSDAYTIAGGTSRESSANDDGSVNCGEVIELYVDLRNQGTDSAEDVNAAISTSDAYVTWLHNTTSSYPDIPSGGTGRNRSSFDLAVDPATPDGHVIHFELEITASNGGPWPGSFDVPVVRAFSVRVAYICDWDTASRDSFDALLTSRGYAVDLVSLSDAETFDFSSHEAIIIGDDTGFLHSWGTPAAVSNVDGAGKPIVGVGEGGYAYFRQLGLAIGIHGMHSTGDGVVVLDAANPIWSSPNDVGATTGSVVTLYTGDVHLAEIYTPPSVTGVTRIGRHPSEGGYCPLSAQTGTAQCYLLWGFTGSPASMTATGQDLFINALSGEACVAPGVGPLAYEKHVVDDDTEGESSGNDDGIVNCGEVIELYVELRNQGTDATDGANATISTSDAYVTWLENTSSSYPIILGASTKRNYDDFEFEVDPATPDGHVIHFDLDMSAANGGPWAASFDVPVMCRVPVPDIHVAPDRFEVTLTEGEVSTEVMTIENVGSELLTFEISESGAAASTAVHRPQGASTVPSSVGVARPMSELLLNPVELPISTESGHQLLPAVACNIEQDEYLVVWQERVDNPDICAQRVSSSGQLQGSKIAVCTTPEKQQRPVVAYNSQRDEYLVVWQDGTGEGNTSGYNYIHAQRLSWDGQLLGSVIIVSEATNWQIRPDVAYNSLDDEYLVVWQNGTVDVVGRRVSGSGTPQDSESIICSAPRPQTSPSVAHNPHANEYMVTWDDYRNSMDHDIYGCAVSASGIPGAEIEICMQAGDQSGPEVAFCSATSEHLVAWPDYSVEPTELYPDLYGQRVSEAGDLVGDRLALSTAQWGQQDPGIVFDPVSGEYLAVWMNSSPCDIRARRLSADGDLLGSEFAICDAGQDQRVPVIALNPTTGGHLVAWEDYRSGSDSDIYGYVDPGSPPGPDVPWLSEDPTSGTVPAGTAVPVDVTFDATGLAADTYIAELIIASNDPDENPVTVPVTLHVTGDPYEPNDDPAHATAFDCGDVISAIIDPAGDVDYYRFTSSADWTIVADVDARINDSSLDSVLTLFDSDGATTLAENDDFGGSFDSRIAYFLPHDGTFYLRVRDYGTPHGGADFFYTLSLHCVPPPDIDVWPDSFEVTVGPAQSAERTMIIRNTGLSDLWFGIGKALDSYAALSEPLVIRVPASTPVPLPQAELEGGSQPSTPKDVRGYEFVIGGVSLLADDPADVLLVYADCCPSQLQAFLRASTDTGAVDTWNAYDSTPTLPDLTPYDIVIAWNNAPWADPDFIGDVLANYHDVGGSVILTVDCWSAGIWRTGGRLITEQYSPFSSLGGAVGNNVTLGWYDAAHPLMDGVDSAAASFHNQVELNPGAELIAEWHDGMPFVATKEIGGHRVLAINTHYANGRPAWSTDAPLILHNAIGYLLTGEVAPWLRANPRSGTVNAGESQEIVVTFDTAGLTVGTHTADLLIASNDPDENPVIAPVTLLVDHTPQVGTVTPDSGSGPAGVTTHFTTTWSDGDGWEDLKQCYFHIGASASVAGNVTLMYNAANNKLWLRNDAGTNWTGGHAPGSSNVLENSQAIVHCDLTSMHGAGDTLGVTWAIEFKPGYTGTKKLGLKCKDRHGVKATAAWKGTWAIE